MSTSSKFEPFVEAVKSNCPIIFIETHEEARALTYLRGGLDKFKFFIWDTVRGFVFTDEEMGKQARKLKEEAAESLEDEGEEAVVPFEQMVTPVAALKEYLALPEDPDTDHDYDKSVLFMLDMPRFLDKAETIRTIKNAIPQLKDRIRCLVFIGPSVTIPPELERDVCVFRLPLPDLSMIKAMLEGHKRELGQKVEASDEVLSHALGMTLSEIEDAIFLSIYRHDEIRAEVLAEAKLNVIKKNDLLEIFKPLPVEQVGGLEVLKEYISRRAERLKRPNPPRLRGILLIGPPGAGKSTACKMIASILGRTLVRFNFDKMKNMYQGESGNRLRTAQSMIDSLGKVAIWREEVEKSFGGVMSSNQTDGGTTASMFGEMLTWQQESEGQHYFVDTANDIDVLLQISQGALLRRYDDIFFVDLPNAAERRAILEIHKALNHSDISVDYADQLEGWSGGEIEKFVIKADIDGVEAALTGIKPLSLQNAALIERARDWGIKNAIIANLTDEELQVANG